MEIIQYIQKDHDDLKDMMHDLKSDDVSIAKKRNTWKSFTPLLDSHTVAEEKVLLVPTKRRRELRPHAVESYEEHRLIDMMITKLDRTQSNELFKARAKVLCELLEHHLKEEENDFFPLVEQSVPLAERIELGREYMQMREETQKSTNGKNRGALDPIAADTSGLLAGISAWLRF